MPINAIRLCNSDWNWAEEKMEKKLSVWKGRNISYGGRLILITSSLSNIPLYMISLFELPKGPRKKMNFFMKRMLWQEEEGVKKYHLVKWEDVCRPKEMGGLGILDLDIMNICLLCKWIWKLENGSGMWQDLARKKYLSRCTLRDSKKKPGHSHFWQGLMKVKPIFLQYCRKMVGNGERTMF